MNPLLVNTSATGGAAKSCLRLHDGLLKQKTNSTLLLRSGEVNVFNSSSKKIKKRLRGRFSQMLRNYGVGPAISSKNRKALAMSRPKGLEYYSFPQSSFDITKTSAYKDADIINLHWVADFLDWKSFFKRNTKPVVWTLHDQNPFLGIDHYDERFLGIDDRGHPIPRERTALEQEIEARACAIKKEILAQVDNLSIVTPSKWLYESSRKSDLFGRFPHHHIPYGYDTSIFKPYDKGVCREILGLPQDKILLLFVSDLVGNNRKGFAYLLRAIEQLSESMLAKVSLCSIGAGSIASNSKYAESVTQLGQIHDERLMAMAYSAADAFVIPSLEDNLPNTMIEALLCDTPVIGFNAGGIPDAVIDGVNGYICPEISVSSLSQTIEKFIDKPHAFKEREIATRANDEYSLEKQAVAYDTLFRQILASGPNLVVRS